MEKNEDFEPKPKRKRYYPQVGEPTLREQRESTEDATAEDEGPSVKKMLVGVLAGVLAVLLAEEGESVRARTVLTPEQYSIADQAHMTNGAYVVQCRKNKKAI